MLADREYERCWEGKWQDMFRFGPVHRHQRRIFAALLADFAGCDGISSVLDVGCGDASNLLFLGNIFPQADLSGCDLSGCALDKARLNLPKADFFQLDIQKESKERQYDLVLNCDVLEHLSDDDAAVRNISLMCRRFLLLASVQGRMREFEANVGHVRNYIPGQLKEKLQSNGFKVIAELNWGFPFYSPFYRDLFNNPAVENVSYGKYGLMKKMICWMIYRIFFLNSHKKGDMVVILCEKNNM